MHSIRKLQLMDKILQLSKTVKEIKPRNYEEALLATERLIYLSNIHELKEFLIDRKCQGRKPGIIVESPHTDPTTGMMQDVFYMPNEAKYNQEILDMLKKQEIIPDDSTQDDYDFILRK